ncbi:Opioid growth factor receptor [Balamuthia mandrillaris]
MEREEQQREEQAPPVVPDKKEGRHGEEEEGEEEEAGTKQQKESRQTTNTATTHTSVRKNVALRNYLFYCNQVCSQPDGAEIDYMHKYWFYNYNLLEKHHGYIQWLFPIFESGGTNRNSFALSKKEANLIREDLGSAFRVLKSFRLMLNFYGMRLVDLHSGQIARTEEWEERYENLNRLTHNNLRISRILISLGELGFGRYKKPWLKHFEEEMEKGLLRNCHTPYRRYWRMLAYEEDSEAYVAKTKEEPEDRTESVFFSHLGADSSAAMSDELQELFRKEEEEAKEMQQLKLQFSAKKEKKQQQFKSHGGGAAARRANAKQQEKLNKKNRTKRK